MRKEESPCPVCGQISNEKRCPTCDALTSVPCTGSCSHCPNRVPCDAMKARIRENLSKG